MTTRLADAEWGAELTRALRAEATELRIICPFIKAGALGRLLSHRPDRIQVITRFSLTNFAEGVSDIAALRKLFDFGARVRGMRNLHAKLYMFGASRAIITSANLTEAAHNRNHEFGMIARNANVIASCRAYFERLWRRSGIDLTAAQIEEWEETITRHRVMGARPNHPGGLGDFGADVGIPAPPPVILPPVIADAPQAFVKLLGTGNSRVPLSYSTIAEIDRAGCHWALSYPESKRPSGVHNGALMFVSRLTRSPNDIRVFGRAIGMRHVRGRDDATAADIRRRDFMATWPHFVRVHHAEFVAGPWRTASPSTK